MQNQGHDGACWVCVDGWILVLVWMGGSVCVDGWILVGEWGCGSWCVCVLGGGDPG